jgi:hypothetical protein
MQGSCRKKRLILKDLKRLAAQISAQYVMCLIFISNLPANPASLSIG